MRRAIVDTSVLVGSMDARDSQHGRAVALVSALDAASVAVLLLDCVAVECVGVICRRRAERRAGPTPLPDFASRFPLGCLTTAYPMLLESWEQILEDVVASDGRLNAHDALIIAFAKKEGVHCIATFDSDLSGRGVDVVASPDDLTHTTLRSQSPGGKMKL